MQYTKLKIETSFNLKKMNRHFRVLWILCLFTIPNFSSNVFGQGQDNMGSSSAKPFNIGEIVEIDSHILGEKRVLNIYLPEGYTKDSSTTYPVIYLLDGSVNEDFIHIVGLVQFFDLQMVMPKTIVVGIANVDRKRDFTFPTSNQELKDKYPTTGGSEKFINFIEKELQPFISQNYRTNETKILIGQSLGGLVATEILLKNAPLFSHYIIISPSLWWDDESLLKNAPTLFAQQNNMPKYVYVSVGSEGSIMEKGAKRIARVLQNGGKNGLKVDFVFLPKENHATILHESVYQAFKILYPYKDP
jgi:predicted alpha/beta superfamily hydrolase